VECPFSNPVRVARGIGRDGPDEPEDGFHHPTTRPEGGAKSHLIGFKISQWPLVSGPDRHRWSYYPSLSFRPGF
jgi:hypothetical protein